MVPIIFFVLVFILLFILGLLFASVDRQDVIANWDQKRCDLPVIMAANFYLPPGDTRSGSEFATENFQFCMNQIIREVFTMALAPFLSLFGTQMDAAGVIRQIMTSLRGMLGTFQKKFSDLLDGVFRRFMHVGFQVRQVYRRFLDLMGKANAIALSTVFTGMSMVVGIDNAVKFVEKVVIIILGIIIGLIILLFVVLIPFIPAIILPTIAILGASAGGMAGAFCFSADTLIKKKDGTKVRIHSLKMGDILEDGSEVEGILFFNGDNIDLYQLGTVRVSADHLVYYEGLGTWISVREHPNSTRVPPEPLLICLNTTTRNIPIDGYRFRDWEEIPPNRPDLNTEWNRMIAAKLDTTNLYDGHQYPILAPYWSVKHKINGLIFLSDVRLGDEIIDIDGNYTNVLGIFYSEEEVSSEKFWTSDSIWWKIDGHWQQKPASTNRVSKKGIHLITESGTFAIFNENSIFEIRDFTEIGYKRISETYHWMKKNIGY
jgi:hypothetical protein